MNYTTAIFLINDQVRAIEIAYSPEEEPRDKKHPQGPAKGRTWVFKTFDQNIKKDDLVIIPTQTRYGFTAVKVVDVDVDVDLDGDIDYKWVLGAVDTKQYERILEDEAQAVKTMRQLEKGKKRREMMETMYNGDLSKIAALPISTLKQVEKPKESGEEEK